jgi:hypothetical protein
MKVSVIFIKMHSSITFITDLKNSNTCMTDKNIYNLISFFKQKYAKLFSVNCMLYYLKRDRYVNISYISY